jgi:peptidyl-prolyl cis-trans isomerase SurA
MGEENNSKRAFRIVHLDKRIPEHVANLEQDYERIKNVALREKQSRIMSKRIAELRQDMYVEYKIPVPEQFRNS